MFELCPGTSQRCVAYKGQHRDANNIKLCLKVLNECGSNIPRFVSYYLDELPPVTFSSLDVSCLLRRMEQLCAEVGALKHITQLQTGVCEQVCAEAVEINHRVSVLECRSGNPTASAVAAAGISPGSKKAFHHGPGNAKEPTPGVRGGEHAMAVEQGVEGLADLHIMGDAFARCPEPVQCRRDGTVAVDAATGKDPAGSVSSTGSPSWSKVARNGRAWQKTMFVATALGGHATTAGRKRSGPASIIGTGTMSTIKTVKTKIVSVFATKFSPELDADTLADYLKSKLNRVVTCQKIDNARSRVGSFKVTAECNDIGEMYTPELWPEGALIRRYYEPRKASVVGFCRVPSEREANGHSGVDPSA